MKSSEPYNIYYIDNIDSFSTQINLNLNDNLNIFLAKFDIKYSAFFAKKRKKWENPKGTKQNEQNFNA